MLTFKRGPMLTPLETSLKILAGRYPPMLTCPLNPSPAQLKRPPSLTDRTRRMTDWLENGRQMRRESSLPENGWQMRRESLRPENSQQMRNEETSWESSLPESVRWMKRSSSCPESGHWTSAAAHSPPSARRRGPWLHWREPACPLASSTCAVLSRPASSGARSWIRAAALRARPPEVGRSASTHGRAWQWPNRSRSSCRIPKRPSGRRSTRHPDGECRGTQVNLGRNASAAERSHS
mmetsp:Transcript_44013/g.93667  ORF Transcript_44013/g.93667 Transcript_44013/m.93667 type:complete len:237 (-) Transcript_44013:458-1168(-)